MPASGSGEGSLTIPASKIQGPVIQQQQDAAQGVGWAEFEGRYYYGENFGYTNYGAITAFYIEHPEQGRVYLERRVQLPINLEGNKVAIPLAVRSDIGGSGESTNFPAGMPVYITPRDDRARGVIEMSLPTDTPPGEISIWEYFEAQCGLPPGASGRISRYDMTGLTPPAYNVWEDGGQITIERQDGSGIRDEFFITAIDLTPAGDGQPYPFVRCEVVAAVSGAESERYNGSNIIAAMSAAHQNSPGVFDFPINIAGISTPQEVLPNSPKWSGGRIAGSIEDSTIVQSRAAVFPNNGYGDNGPFYTATWGGPGFTGGQTEQSASAEWPATLRWVELASFSSDYDQPLELDLSVTIDGEVFSGPIDLRAGGLERDTLPPLEGQWLTGVMRLQFDQVGRVLMTDLRNGRTSLGNHRHVRAEVQVVGVGGIQAEDFRLTLRARIAGTIGDADYLRYSTLGVIYQDVRQIPIPPGAQWWQLEVSDLNGATASGTLEVMPPRGQPGFAFPASQRTSPVYPIGAYSAVQALGDQTVAQSPPVLRLFRDGSPLQTQVTFYVR